MSESNREIAAAFDPLDLRLETTRLILRVPQAGDAPDLARWCADFELSRWTANIPHPYAIADAHAYIADARRALAAAEALTLAVERKEEAGVVGMIGVSLDGPGTEGDMGWWIAVPFHGRGYATEAASCAVDFARAMGVKRLTAGTHPENLRSQNVARKLGMRPAGRLVRTQPARGVPLETVEFAMTL
jgi:RimJ/RimL family protein N-acetyltransferase